jgi:uncharacterized membrane protein YcaP (DUF421 family)
MNAFSNYLGPLLGLGYEAKDLTFVQISLRAVIVFLATLVMVRLGHKRSLARKSAFDVVLIIILASFLARAINGTSPLSSTIGAGFVVVLLNRLLALIAYHSHSFGVLIKGRPEIIVEDGNLILSTMNRNHISRHDLEEDMHLRAHTDDLSKVRLARVERSGDISFIKK